MRKKDFFHALTISLEKSIKGIEALWNVMELPYGGSYFSK